MRNYLQIGLSLAILGYCSALCAQGLQTPSPFCSPGVTGASPSKALAINYDVLNPYRSQSLTADGEKPLGDANRLSLRVKFPFVLKPGFKLLGGFQYRSEHISFLPPSEGELPYRLSEFREESLRSIGGEIIALKQTRGRVYLMGQFKMNLSGDLDAPNRKTSEYIRASFSGLIGWKENPNFTWGLGFSYRYSFGRHIAFPVIHYQQTFNRKWGIEATLPASVEIRRNISEKTILYTGIRLSGNGYLTELPEDQSDVGQLVDLGYVELRSSLRLEQEIHDFLWFGASIGYQVPFLEQIRTPRKEGGITLYRPNLARGMYANVGLYLVIPKKFR